MMTSTEQEAFFRFKMKPLPLLQMVFVARGDYVPPVTAVGHAEAATIQPETFDKLERATTLTKHVNAMVDGSTCPGIEIEPGVFSGCSGTGGDCPVCGK